MICKLESKLLFPHTGMKKLADVDTAIVTQQAFLPNQTPGPNIPSGTESALDYFLLFFDPDIIDMICVSSNSYAELLQDRYKYSYQYYPKEGLNRINFKIFMVVVVYMSLHPRDDYTHTGIQTRFFSSEFIQRVPMSRNVFSSILTFLHVSGINPCKIQQIAFIKFVFF